MSNNYNPFKNQENNNNNIEPFDKIEQGQKRYIPNIPSVISDMQKNNIQMTSEKENENIKENKEEKTNNEIEENKIYETKEKDLLLNNEDKVNNQNSFVNTIANYWNTFRNNQTVSTIINPFQDDSECVNKIYKIYSCITISLILIVILLSITLS